MAKRKVSSYGKPGKTGGESKQKRTHMRQVAKRTRATGNKRGMATAKERYSGKKRGR